MTDLRVTSGGGGYAVRILERFDEVGRVPPAILRDGGRVVVLTDDQVGPLHAGTFAEALASLGLHAEMLTMPAGELHKTVDTWLRLSRELVGLGATRDTPIVALGGGIVGDVAGFVASTYMRGVPLLQVPTTLLAMVDSSIGGKTGVDLPSGKNLLGTFWPPMEVWSYLPHLRTLPARRVREGLAEVLKYGYIADPDLLDLSLRLDPERPLADGSLLRTIVRRSAAVKARIVSADEREGGLRRVLNFGHTVGHAIEHGLGFHELTHGEAVGLGMLAAHAIGARLGVSSGDLVLDARHRLRRLGLPWRIPAQLSAETLHAAMLRDKKRGHEGVRFVLTPEAGRAEIHTLRPSTLSDLLHAVIGDLR